MAENTLLAGRYRLESRLGRGGMADVWRARDEFLGRTVAVKEVRLPSGLDEERRADFCERFLREARAAAALPHPSIITVHDVLRQDGRPWIVMDLIDGPSLEGVRAERGPLPPRKAAEIGLQLLDALCLAHERGILHRDVKPANVLLSGDRAILTDFGIAVLSGDQRLTSAEGIVGSPGYMAPERLQDGHGAGPSSDLWALGATLYTLVEGRHPFERPTALAMLGAVLTEDVPPPRLAGPLGPVLVAMMNRNPHLRPVPAEIRRAFQAAAGVAPVSPPVFRPSPPAGGGFPSTVPGSMATPSGRRRRGSLTAGAALVLAAAAALGFVLLRPADAPPVSAPPSPSATLIAAPDPCGLLTAEQSSELVNTPKASAKGTDACSWGDLDLKVRFLPPQGGQPPEETAKKTFAFLRRQATSSAGTSADPVSTVVKSAPRDLPGLGEEAFAQDTATTGTFASTHSVLSARSGRLILQVEYGGESATVQNAQDITLKAARYALQSITS